MIDNDNLLFSLGYENAKIKFMKLGYKVIKIETDFGFNLLVTDEKKTSTRLIDKNYSVLQVKVGRLNEYKYNEQGSRRYGTVDFIISKTHLENLINEQNSFMLCYIIDEENYEIIGYFWLNNSHLKYLNNEKNPKYNSKWTWFNEEQNGYFVLRARITTEINIEDQYGSMLGSFKKIIDSKIPEWSSDYNDFNYIYNTLQHLIEKSDIRNKNSNNKIELIASTARSGKFGSSLQMVNELLDVSNFRNELEESPFIYKR